MFRAELETRKYSYEVYGEDVAACKILMQQLFKRHTGAPYKEFIAKYWSSVNVYQVDIGWGFVDRERAL